jgi:hypothetical protein
MTANGGGDFGSVVKHAEAASLCRYGRSRSSTGVEGRKHVFNRVRCVELLRFERRSRLLCLITGEHDACWPGRREVPRIDSCELGGRRVSRRTSDVVRKATLAAIAFSFGEMPTDDRQVWCRPRLPLELAVSFMGLEVIFEGKWGELWGRRWVHSRGNDDVVWLNHHVLLPGRSLHHVHRWDLCWDHLWLLCVLHRLLRPHPAVIHALRMVRQ